MINADTILMIHGDETVARVQCSVGYTHDLFHKVKYQVDYVVACDQAGGVLWVADGMAEEVWLPDGTNNEETRKATLERFPELRGKW